MDFKKSGNFNWIEMDSKDQNLDWTRTKWISVHFNQFSFAGDNAAMQVCLHKSLKLTNV